MENAVSGKAAERFAEINNLALAYLVDEIKPKIEGGFINKIQSINQELTKIKVHTKDGSRDLIIAPSAIFIAQHSFPGMQKGKMNFIEAVKKIIDNKRIISATQHSFDRVVVIELPQHFLFIELFGGGNLVLTDKELLIVAVKKAEIAKDRTLKKGHKYAFPAGRGLSPLELNEHLGVLTEGAESGIGKALIKAVNLSPAMAEEALSLLGIDKDKPVETFSKKELSKIAEKIKDIHTVSKDKYRPMRIGNSLLPFRLSSVKGNGIEIESLNNEFDEFYSRTVVAAEHVARAEGASKEKQKAEHSYNQLVAAKEKMEKQSDLNKKKGEALYANFQKIQEVMDAVKKALEKKIPEKEIAQKINSTLERSSDSNIRLKRIDLKTKQMVVEVKE